MTDRLRELYGQFVVGASGALVVAGSVHFWWTQYIVFPLAVTFWMLAAARVVTLKNRQIAELIKICDHRQVTVKNLRAQVKNLVFRAEEAEREFRRVRNELLDR